jgi:hypothetical protein
MTFTNLGINSASTKDCLDAMKNQSSSGGSPSHSSGPAVPSFTKEDFETALEQVSKRVGSSESAAKKK